MAVLRETPKDDKFNPDAVLPFSMRIEDFRAAMLDVYDFLYDVNKHLVGKNLARLDDMLRAANLSGTISDMLTVSMAKHSRSLVVNAHHNGHPDLLVQGQYPNNAAKAGEAGVEIKSTRKVGGAVDTHGGRDQWMCVFVYAVDNKTEPAIERRALRFTEIYLAQVSVAHFRNNPRGELGTKTSTLGKEGVKVLRAGWVYLDKPDPTPRKATARKAVAKKAPTKKASVGMDVQPSTLSARKRGKASTATSK